MSFFEDAAKAAALVAKFYLATISPCFPLRFR
jgi:hypothetical protein